MVIEERRGIEDQHSHFVGIFVCIGGRGTGRLVKCQRSYFTSEHQDALATQLAATSLSTTPAASQGWFHTIELQNEMRVLFMDNQPESALGSGQPGR